MRGPKDTTVELSIQRGNTIPFQLKIVRDVIQEREVESRELVDGRVGYLRLEGFSDRAAADFAAAVKAHVDAGRRMLILDLRGNPGGYVTAARDGRQPVHRLGADLLGAGREGRPTSRPTRSPAASRRIRRSASSVLIDRGSASASEIVAAALHDSGRATLVGQRSFGKGTVQQWQELAGEGGAFRLTIAKWLTPDKRWIHDIGIEPDVTVERPGDPRTGRGSGPRPGARCRRRRSSACRLGGP